MTDLADKLADMCETAERSGSHVANVSIGADMVRDIIAALRDRDWLREQFHSDGAIATECWELLRDDVVDPDRETLAVVVRRLVAERDGLRERLRRVDGAAEVVQPGAAETRVTLTFGDYWRDNLVALLQAFPECNSGDWYGELLFALNVEDGTGSPNSTAEELREAVRRSIPCPHHGPDTGERTPCCLVSVRKASTQP